MTRAKANKQTKGKQAKGKQAKNKPFLRGLPWFAWLLIALAIAGIVAFVRIYPPGQPAPGNMGTPRAAIVDQLYSLQPNPVFIDQVTQELEDYGFEVDLYQDDEVTVDLYRELPGYGYKLIVFRAHSGLLGEDEKVHVQTTLFTNEPYSGLKYSREQLDDRLVMASVGEGYPMVFGIPPKFVTKSMKGEFDDTVIIMMGCSGIFLPDLAKAFVDKGASAYFAWNATVNLDYVDKATPYLIGQLYSEQLTIKEAVDSTMDVIGPDPRYKAVLKYYPSGSGDKTLGELIK